MEHVLLVLVRGSEVAAVWPLTELSLFILFVCVLKYDIRHFLMIILRFEQGAFILFTIPYLSNRHSVTCVVSEYLSM